MLQPTAAVKYNTVNISSLDGKRQFDLTKQLLHTDYYEDLLEPTVSVNLAIVSTYNIVEELPIRGGELVTIDIETYSGAFKQDFIVYGVKNESMEKQKVSFNLHLIPAEWISNQYAEIGKKFQYLPVNTHVEEMLRDRLKIKEGRIGTIEPTSNSLSFYGNNKTPFWLIRWLGPQSISIPGGVKGEDTSENDADPELISHGTAGFVFYQNKDGFHFRSIDTLAMKTKSQISSADDESIQTYVFGEVNKTHSSENIFKIISYYFDKNNDLRTSMRVGMYANKVINFSPKTQNVVTYFYNLKDELNNDLKLGSESKISAPEDQESEKSTIVRPADLFGSSTRTFFNISDEGVHDPSGANDPVKYRTTEAKSFSRYNLMFTQGLNILVPCNVQLKVGDIIRCFFPENQGGKADKSEDKISGLYLIKELRHHFSSNQNTTSLKLIRDSYGYK